MAVYTINTNNANQAVRYLESQVITNLAADASVKGVVKVPGWAKYCSVYHFITSTGGTSASLALKLYIPDFSTAALFGAPTDTNQALIADFAGATAVTGAGPYLQTINLGPGVTGIADDATGAAAADATMSVNCVLPPWLAYDIAADGDDTDEDYSYSLVMSFRA